MLERLFGKVVVLALLVGAAYAGWQWGPQVFPRVHDWLGLSGSEAVDEPVASAPLADSVLARVQSLRRGDGPNQLVLGDNELTSILRFSVPGLIPDGVTEPQVRLQEGRVLFRAKVALSSFPNLPDLGPIIGFLPDTLDVALEASMMPFGEGTAALLIHSLEASHIPLPRRLVPEILSAMGRKDRPGLPPEALLIPLPSGLGSAYILTDSLILSQNP